MKISVLGCGSFGTALAHLLSKNHTVHCWEYDKERAAIVLKTGKSDMLPYRYGKNILISADIISVVQNADYIFIAIPSQFVVTTISIVKRHLKKDASLIIGSKGLDPATNSLLFDSLQHKISHKIFVLSGPMFAGDIIKDSPCGGMLSGKDKKAGLPIMQLFAKSPLHLEWSDDTTGVSFCGAVKNAYAIGSGVMKGLGYEQSSVLFYLTRCLQELEKILIKLKSHKDTFVSFAGAGDLMLTGTTNKSRNFRFGELVGKGIAPRHIEFTVEGKISLPVLIHFLRAKKIDAPIISTLYDIVYKNKSSETILSAIH